MRNILLSLVVNLAIFLPAGCSAFIVCDDVPGYTVCVADKTETQVDRTILSSMLSDFSEYYDREHGYDILPNLDDFNIEISNHDPEHPNLHGRTWFVPVERSWVAWEEERSFCSTAFFHEMLHASLWWHKGQTGGDHTPKTGWPANFEDVDKRELKQNCLQSDYSFPR